MTHQERRLCRRTSLEQLAFIGLPSDNGGIVLDVSEGGLGFQAISPVEAGKLIHFQFSGRPVAGTGGLGEIVWTDETGKNGGLRFTQLPDEIREQIHIWSGQPSTEVSFVEVSASTNEITIAPTNMDDSISNPETTHPADIDNSPAFNAPVNPLSLFSTEPEPAAEASFGTPPHSVYSKHGLAAVLVTLLSASALAVGILSFVYMHKPVQSIMHLLEKIRGHHFPNP